MGSEVQGQLWLLSKLEPSLKLQDSTVENRQLINVFVFLGGAFFSLCLISNDFAAMPHSQPPITEINTEIV